MDLITLLLAPTIALLILLAPGLAAAGEAVRDELALLIHIGFDGGPDADGAPGTLAAAEATDIKFAEGKVGQAADFREGGCVEYMDLPALNMESGTLELWVNPAHDAKEMEDHTYLQFLKEDESGGIQLKFYHMEMAAQVRMWSGDRVHRRYGGGHDQDQWSHIVVTWESADSDEAGLRIYRDGKEGGYPASYEPVDAPGFLRVGCASPEEGESAKALVDEICVYNRCLTAPQVELLTECGDLAVTDKVARLRERVADDDALERERADLLTNHRKLGIIHGRNTSLLNWPDERFASLRIPVPEPIHETVLDATDLSRYDVLFVPGGGGLNLTDSNREALHRFIREGGGYVGVCGGANSATRAGLIGPEQYAFGVRGPVWVTLKPHPITEGFDLERKILFPHASGPLWVVTDESEQVLAVFDVGGPPLPTFVHTIAKHYGKGRIVTFSGHPEAATHTRGLLRNAVMWVGRIIAEGGEEERD
jgi:hypothetical protein